MTFFFQRMQYVVPQVPVPLLACLLENATHEDARVHKGITTCEAGNAQTKTSTNKLREHISSAFDAQRRKWAPPQHYTR